jgi:hypothetical protein
MCGIRVHCLNLDNMASPRIMWKQELLTFPEYPRSSPVLSGVRVSWSLILCACFEYRCLSFCALLLIIVVSVLWYTDPDYPFRSALYCIYDVKDNVIDATQHSADAWQYKVLFWNRPDGREQVKQLFHKMGAIANPWFRFLPPEPVNDPPFNGAPTGPVHMPPRNASPILYCYLLFPIDIIKELVRQTNRLVKP